MLKGKYIVINFLLFVFLSSTMLRAEKIYNIEKYGAKADNKTVNTSAIQMAIDACTKDGGGTVLIPEGAFVSGTIELKDNVNLHLEEGAVIYGSTNKDHYPYNDTLFKSRSMALVRAYHADNISITGKGTLNGNGGHEAFHGTDNSYERPKVIFLSKCNNVAFKDFTARDAAFWTIHIWGCDGVDIDGIEIYSDVHWNNDGLDINSRNVTIKNCIIETGDDALCFKSKHDEICENVVVENCKLASHTNAIKTGTISYVGFKNIKVTNCEVYKMPHDSDIRDWKTGGLSGIALEIVDGGEMDNIFISDITIEGYKSPIYVKLGFRGKDSRQGTMKNIILQNIRAEGNSKIASNITGVPKQYIENITLRNIHFISPGGGNEEEARELVPEVFGYPETKYWGNSLPVYGLYLRNINNLVMENITFEALSEDKRDPYKLVRVKNETLKEVNVIADR